MIIVLSLLLTPYFTPAADILTGLVSYWPLEVNNGGTTPDSSFANNLTVNGAPTIAAIAGVLGYDDPLYFSRVFKAVNNTTPTLYRATHR